MVIWILGISGVGKTFFAKELLKKIKGKKFHIDGDELRANFFKKLGYSKKDRKISGNLTVKLCKYLEEKNFTVVVSMQSMFPRMQKENRTIFKKYFQIYIKSNLNLLKKRDNKKIYLKSSNVLGLNLKFPKPYKSHMLIKNNFDKSYKSQIKKVLKKINI
tara:strand:- start:253 stop:732 length:480 start_codon:yes stop_codon:yes gene_type:complete